MHIIESCRDSDSGRAHLEISIQKNHPACVGEMATNITLKRHFKPQVQVTEIHFIIDDLQMGIKFCNPQLEPRVGYY